MAGRFALLTFITEHTQCGLTLRMSHRHTENMEQPKTLPIDPNAPLPVGLHAVVMRRLLAAIIHIGTEQMKIWRYNREIRRQEKCEWSEPDSMMASEIPTSGTMSGWMRNDREANEYIQQLKREGA